MLDFWCAITPWFQGFGFGISTLKSRAFGGALRCSTNKTVEPWKTRKKNRSWEMVQKTPRKTNR